MKDFVKKYQHQLFALLNTIIIFAYAFMISGLYYETNDDATLSNISNGAFGANTQDLIYVNVCFSYFIKILHSVFPGINFVVILQLILVFISIWALIVLLEEKLGTLWGLRFSVILCIPFATELISKFQYVKTSTIIISAGLLLIATNLSKNNIKMALGFILTVSGCFVRFESFISSGALSAFPLLYYFFSLSKKEKKKAVLQMIALFTIVFSFELLNTAYYKYTPEWSDFTSYNDARTTLSDYKENYIPVYFDNVVASGFSENDVQMLYTRNYFDNTVFTTDVINKAAESVSKKPADHIVADFLHVAINLVQLLNEKFYRIGIIFSLLLFVFSNKKSKIYQFFTFGMFGLLLLYLMIVNRFMSRIETMLVIALICNIMILYQPAKLKKLSPNLIVVAVMTVIIVYNMPVQVAYRKNKLSAYKTTATKYEAVVQQMSQSKENLYLFDPVQTDYFAGYDVFNPRPEGFFSNICPTGSWYSNSMFTNDVLEKYGLASPLIDSVNNSSVYISNEFIDIKLKYVQEHFNENVYAVKVSDNGLCDYQFKLD